MNQAWQETLGYSEAELEHLSIFQIIHPEDLTHCQTAMQRLFTGEKFIGIETRFLTKDGRIIVVEGNVNCQLKDDIPISTRGIFRDITERKEAEKALEELNKQLTYDPKNLDVLTPIAEINERLNRIPEAIVAREAIRTLDPWNSKNLLQLGREYQFIGDFNKMQEVREAILKFDSVSKESEAAKAELVVE